MKKTHLPLGRFCAKGTASSGDPGKTEIANKQTNKQTPNATLCCCQGWDIGIPPYQGSTRAIPLAGFEVPQDANEMGMGSEDAIIIPSQTIGGCFCLLGKCQSSIGIALFFLVEGGLFGGCLSRNASSAASARKAQKK